MVEYFTLLPHPLSLSARAQYLIDSEILIPLIIHVESPPLDMSNQKYKEGLTEC
jgi:hypothetical protein